MSEVSKKEQGVSVSCLKTATKNKVLSLAVIVGGTHQKVQGRSHMDRAGK